MNIIKTVLKKIILFMLLIAIGLGSAYYVVQRDQLTDVENAKNIIKKDLAIIQNKILELIPQEQKSNTLTINTNQESNIGAVLNFNNGGGGLVIYTTKYHGLERVDKIVARSKDGKLAIMTVNPETLLPEKMEIDGYIYNYHRFTNIGVDISVTDPYGNTSEIETVLFGQKFAMKTSIIPIAHSAIITKGVSWIAKNIQKFMAKKVALTSLNKLDFDDTMDEKLWSDYIGKLETISVCAVSLVTMAVPNPASAIGIAVSCGSYLAETLPYRTDIVPDICNMEDAYTTSCFENIINSVKKKLVESGDFFLQGSVEPDIFIPSGFGTDATLTFTHRSGKIITFQTPKRFGICRPTKKKVGAFTENVPEENCVDGKILKQGRYDVVVSVEGFVPRKFALAISDKRILIKEGKKTVFEEKRHGFYSRVRWDIRLEKSEKVETIEESKEKKILAVPLINMGLDITYKWTGGTEQYKKDGTWCSISKSYLQSFEYIIKDNSLFLRRSVNKEKIGTINPDGTITISAIDSYSKGFSAQGILLDVKANSSGKGSGTWTQKTIMQPGHKNTRTVDCFGTWTSP